MEYETIWKPQTVGEAAATRHPIAKDWQELVGSGPFSRSVQKLCMPMVSNLPKQRNKGTSSQANSRTTSEIIPAPKEETDESSVEGSHCTGLHHGSLDLEAHCNGNPETFPCWLSPQSYLAYSAGFGVELPEARASGTGKRRGEDCTLETLPLAPDKKKLKNLAPISPSSMKAGSCLSPTSVRLGLPEAKLPFTDTAIKETEFPQSLRLRSRQKKGSWPFTCGFTHTTYWGEMSRYSCGISCDTSVDRLFCSGITALLIKKSLSKDSCLRHPDSRSNGYRDTPLNSTPLNMSGLRVNEPYPTVRPTT